MRRIAIRILIVTLLGSVLTYAVAWGLAVLSWYNGSRISDAELEHSGHHWQSLIAFSADFSGSGYLCFSRSRETRLAPGDWPELLDPREGDRNRPASLGSPGSHHIVEVHGRGWPFISHAATTIVILETEQVGDRLGWKQDGGATQLLSDSPEQPQWLIKLKPTASRNASLQHLPMRIIWPGFLLNTFCFSALIYLLCFLPGTLRRTIRRRRGRCIRCGYDLRGLPVSETTGESCCPECGHESVTAPG